MLKTKSINIDKRYSGYENAIRFAKDFLLEDEPEEGEISIYGRSVSINSLTYKMQPYRYDIERWGRDFLKEQYAPDILEMFQSCQNNLITLAPSATQTGKSHGASRFGVHSFLCNPYSQVYLFAAPPEDNLKLILWGQVADIVIRFPELFPPEEFDVSLASMKITRRSNPLSFITGITIPQAAEGYKIKARFAGKHAPVIRFIGDEIDAIPQEVFEAIEGNMSGGDCKLLGLYNPRSQSSYAYQMERRRMGKVVRLSALNHPNVVEGREVIPGAVDRETTVRRINFWTEAIAGEPSNDIEFFEVPDYLVGVQAKDYEGNLLPPLPAGWRRVIVQDFFTMVLGRYPAIAGNQLISEAWVNMAVQRRKVWIAQFGIIPPRDIRPIGGYDVADLGTDRHVLTFRYGGYVEDPIVWGGVDPDEGARRAHEAAIVRVAQYVNVDSTGVGAGVAPRMRRLGTEANRIMVQSAIEEIDIPDNIKEVGIFNSKRDLMLFLLREWLRTDPAAMLPDDEELKDELLAPAYQKDYKGRAGVIKVDSTDVIKEKLKRSPDKLMSLALTFSPFELDGDTTLKSYNYMGYR